MAVVVGMAQQVVVQVLEVVVQVLTELEQKAEMVLQT